MKAVEGKNGMMKLIQKKARKERKGGSHRSAVRDPPKGMLQSQPLVLLNLTLFENRAIIEVIKLK